MSHQGGVACQWHCRSPLDAKRGRHSQWRITYVADLSLAKCIRKVAVIVSKTRLATPVEEAVLGIGRFGSEAVESPYIGRLPTKADRFGGKFVAEEREARLKAPVLSEIPRDIKTEGISVFVFDRYEGLRLHISSK